MHPGQREREKKGHVKSVSVCVTLKKGKELHLAKSIVGSTGLTYFFLFPTFVVLVNNKQGLN